MHTYQEVLFQALYYQAMIAVGTNQPNSNQTLEERIC